MIAKEMIAEKVFAEGVAKDIRNFLPAKYENAEFQVMQMNKNNGVQMVGVQVRLQEENVCPVVYVEPFFNEIRLGEPVEKVMNEIARCMEEAGNVPFLHSGINPMDYDSVKEHLAVMLVNTQANKRMLQEMPHENMEDLSAICYVDFPVESNDGKATMKVKNEHLKMWNVDAKEMFQQARANTQPVNTPILQSMDEMLLSIFNEEGHATNLLAENVDFGLRSHDMLYALTNVEKQYGASMITQPEVLNKLEQLFPEGFYVLPSSVHEVLIVPDNGEMEPKMLGEMVREVNKNEVERQEVLSDRVYSYDKEKHQIRQEPDSIQKVKRSGLNREAYLRQLISGVVPRDAPPPDYYSMMRELHKIGNNLNQIAQKAHVLNVVDVQRYDKEVRKFNEAVRKITEAVILPGKINHGSDINLEHQRLDWKSHQLCGKSR